MPHFIMEYSVNLEQDVNIPALMRVIHREAIETGVFPKGGIRTRAIRCDHVLIADEDTDKVTAGSLVKIAPLYPGSFP